MDKYQLWLEKTKNNNDLYNELLSIKNCPDEIEDRFYRDLSFGTGGLRGVIGAGTNRMNIYSVGKATAGLASYIIKSDIKKSVVIAYDSRNMSNIFANRAADILSAYGIHVYIFDKITPTPILSYAVRELGAGAGIVITASHNPKEYNGYKVYNKNGCQITDSAAKAILSEIKEKDYFDTYNKNESLISILNDEILNKYLDRILNISLFDKVENYAPKIVYTPLHGTGNIPVLKILNRIGISNISIVKEQQEPDGDFTTCPYPNPEEKSALELALKYGEQSGAEMILATDPDADRVGIAIRDNNNCFRLLNGNETGILLMNYMLERKSMMGTLGENPTVLKTIVTTDMAFSVAKKYGATVKEVLTGFKYIGEEMDKTDNFVMGMEESYGYLLGTFARDKDAISAVMMIAEMYAYYKSLGKSLYDQLCDLYSEHGYYLTSLESKTFKGASGAEKMSSIISTIRSKPNIKIEDNEFIFTDFAKGIDGLPKSDVLRFRNDNIRILIRPSGTEPKMKIYYQIKAESFQKAKETLNTISQYINNFLS